MEYNFSKTLDVFSRVLDARLLRNDVLSNNFANADTPNFKKSYVNFENQLKVALESQDSSGFKANMTDPRHIPFNKSIDYRTVNPRKYTDMFSQGDNNGNNVDAEEETAKITKNTLSYNLALTNVKSMFRNIEIVLK